MAVVTLVVEEEFRKWYDSRPPVIRELIDRFPIDRLYRIKSTGHRGTLCSYNEDGTMAVTLDGTFCRVDFARNVFGLLPEDIEECDLPGPDEPTGCLLVGDEEIAEYIQQIKRVLRKGNEQHPQWTDGGGRGVEDEHEAGPTENQNL